MRGLFFCAFYFGDGGFWAISALNDSVAGVKLCRFGE